jgi:hypothetical protein
VAWRGASRAAGKARLRLHLCKQSRIASTTTPALVGSFPCPCIDHLEQQGMVKFSREYEASIIPEWKAAFVNYKSLKKLIKRIKITRRDSGLLLPSPEHVGGDGFSVLDPVRALASRIARTPALAHGAASPVRYSSCPVLSSRPLAPRPSSFVAGCFDSDMPGRRYALGRRRTTALNRIQGSSCDPRTSMYCN